MFATEGPSKADKEAERVLNYLTTLNVHPFSIYPLVPKNPFIRKGQVLMVLTTTNCFKPHH